MLSGTKLQPKAMSGSVVQIQLGSVWMSVACVTSGGLRNHGKMESEGPAELALPFAGLGELALPLTGHCRIRAGPDLW